MDNEYNMYPLLVYKGITYFPMTYYGARFLGLKSNWYQSSRMNDGNGVLFIGVNNEKENELKIIKSTTKNADKYTATIANYGLALNTIEPDEFINNANEEYPIINFRNITYFPLTWKYAVEEFGWEYSYTNEEGLRINCGNPFRPVINDKVIGYTLPYMKAAEYFYGDDIYVVYPYSTYAPVHKLVIRKRGAEEIEYDIESQLKQLSYSIEHLNVEKNENGAFVRSKAYIKDNFLYVNCKGYEKGNTSSEPIQLLLKINLDNGIINLENR